MSIRDFLRMYNVRMEFEHSHQYHCARVMNSLWMHFAFAVYSAREMQWLNACRMHLRVSRLSEIATADGARLRPGLEGHRLTIHLSEARWPRARPLATDWKFWSRMPESLSKTVRPILFVLVWAVECQGSIDEWKTLVSVDTVPRDFSRLPDGSYEVFEEWQDAVQSLSLGF
jgi:hypothetical protein